MHIYIHSSIKRLGNFKRRNLIFELIIIKIEKATTENEILLNLLLLLWESSQKKKIENGKLSIF